jgi:two-component system chemotaxis response regulator CheY
MVDTTIPVLVIDDADAMRTILSKLLNNLGFVDVESVGDGLTALNRLQEKKFGLIISDLHMNPMDGLGLMRLLRGKSEFKDIPVIVISAEATAQNVIEAKKAGAKGYLVKPFTADALKTKVEQALGRG